MNAPFPSQFAFATTAPVAARALRPAPAAAGGHTIRAALRGLVVVGLAVAAALTAS